MQVVGWTGYIWGWRAAGSSRLTSTFMISFFLFSVVDRLGFRVNLSTTQPFDFLFFCRWWGGPSTSGGGAQLVLLDHGMYRTLSDSYRLSYSNLWVALLSQVAFNKFGSPRRRTKRGHT